MDEEKQPLEEGVHIAKVVLHCAYIPLSGVWSEEEFVLKPVVIKDPI